jgi:two-component system, NarL family, nitrate/nitrite response regulator NarL
MNFLLPGGRQTDKMERSMPEKTKLIRIMIADDHAIFRDGLKSLFNGRPEFQVVGEACDGRNVVELVDQLQPDILLLDVVMPKVDGMDALKMLAASPRSVRTIVLCGALEGEDISKAFELGARGLILKETAAETLFKGIQAVMDGLYWVVRKSVTNPVEASKHCRSAEKGASSRNYGLTPREMEIIGFVVSGASNKEIAGKLSISVQTVKHHITNIFDKLGVYNRLELTLFVLHHGLLEK